MCKLDRYDHRSLLLIARLQEFCCSNSAYQVVREKAALDDNHVPQAEPPAYDKEAEAVSPTPASYMYVPVALNPQQHSQTVSSR